MKWAIAFLVLVALAIGFAAALLRARRSKGDSEWPFYAKKPLTQPEQILYFRLLSALPEHIVLAQVQLSRFLGVKKGANVQSWLNRISRMSADYVICQKDASVIAVVELDDASHQSDRRVTADAKKESALRAAGIKLFRWQVRELPDVTTIRTSLLPNPAFNTDPDRRAFGRAGGAG
jgi:very-short-patch-repair endonuclease